MRRTLLFVLGGVLAGVIIHIVVVFLLPGFANRDAWTTMARFGADGEFHLVPVSQPGDEALPFLDPRFVHAVCRFRLSGGPVHVVAPMPDDFWSLGIFDRRGRNLYSLNDRTAARNPLDLFLITPADLARLRSDPPDVLETSIVVDLPIDTGFVLLRAFAADATLVEPIRQTLAKADCDAPVVTTPAEDDEEPPVAEGEANPDAGEAGAAPAAE
jgi:uncharacterized membrane protein